MWSSDAGLHHNGQSPQIFKASQVNSSLLAGSLLMFNELRQIVPGNRGIWLEQLGLSPFTRSVSSNHNTLARQCLLYSIHTLCTLNLMHISLRSITTQS